MTNQKKNREMTEPVLVREDWFFNIFILNFKNNWTFPL